MQMSCWNIRIKLLSHLEIVLFCQNIKKISDDVDYDYVLKDVYNFIHKIKPMEEKINLRLFEDFFESSSPADYARMLINTKNPNENKEFVAKIEDRISGLKDIIKEMGEKKKKEKCGWNTKNYWRNSWLQ